MDHLLFAPGIASSVSDARVYLEGLELEILRLVYALGPGTVAIVVLVAVGLGTRAARSAIAASVAGEVPGRDGEGGSPLRRAA